MVSVRSRRSALSLSARCRPTDYHTRARKRCIDCRNRQPPPSQRAMPFVALTVPLQSTQRRSHGHVPTSPQEAPSTGHLADQSVFQLVFILMAASTSVGSSVSTMPCIPRYMSMVQSSSQQHATLERPWTRNSPDCMHSCVLCLRCKRSQRVASGCDAGAV